MTVDYVLAAAAFLPAMGWAISVSGKLGKLDAMVTSQAIALVRLEHMMGKCVKFHRKMKSTK